MAGYEVGDTIDLVKGTIIGHHNKVKTRRKNK